MKRALFSAVFVLVLAGVTGVIGQTTKYGVKVTTAAKTDFTRFKSYSWFDGHTAFDRAVHKQIVAAIDRELAALGLTKTSGKSDLEVVYHTLRSTVVDVKQARPSAGEEREYQVGTLVVNLLDTATGEQLWHARIDTPIDLDPMKMERIVNDAVAALFQQYPTRKKRN